MQDASPGPPKGRRRRWWTALVGIGAFVVTGLVLGPGLLRHEPESPPRTPWAPPSARARPEPTDRASDGGVTGIFSSSPAAHASESSSGDRSFDCMVSPHEVVEIGSAITGQIDQIYVERGDYVYAGQLVALLESSVERAAVRVARARAEREVEVEAGQANFALSSKRRERAVALFESDSMPLDGREEADTQAKLAALELERAREDHHLASLELEQALAMLKRRAITSPISGLVVERLMSPGEVVEEETILRVAEIAVLRVEVILPSRLFGLVQPGDRAEIVPEPPYDRPRIAEVTIVDRIIDGASGTFGVRLLLPNQGHQIPAGLRCRVHFGES